MSNPILVTVPLIPEMTPETFIALTVCNVKPNPAVLIPPLLTTNESVEAAPVEGLPFGFETIAASAVLFRRLGHAPRCG